MMEEIREEREIKKIPFSLGIKIFY